MRQILKLPDLGADLRKALQLRWVLRVPDFAVFFFGSLVLPENIQVLFDHQLLNPFLASGALAAPVIDRQKQGKVTLRINMSTILLTD